VGTIRSTRALAALAALIPTTEHSPNTWGELFSQRDFCSNQSQTSRPLWLGHLILDFSDGQEFKHEMVEPMAA